MGTYSASLTAKESGTTSIEQTVLLKKDGSMKKYLKNMIITYSIKENKKSMFFEEFGYARGFIDGVNYNSGEIFKHNNNFYQYVSDVRFSNFNSDLSSKKIKKIEPVKVNGNIFSMKNYSNIENLTVYEKSDIEDIFSLEYENNIPYLKISLNDIDSSAKSIQYWYVEDNTLKPVIFVNLSSNNFILNSDKKTGKIEDKIFISILSNRDTRVYDENNRIVGNVLNLSSQNMPPYLFIDQYYDIPPVGPSYSINLIDAGLNYQCRVEKIESPYGDGKIGEISINDNIYYGDKIKISIIPNEEYKFDKIIINGKEYDNNHEVDVYGDIKISAKLISKWTKHIDGESFEFPDVASGYQGYTIYIGDASSTKNKFKVSGDFYCYYNGTIESYTFKDKVLESNYESVELLSFGGVEMPGGAFIISSGLFLSRPSNLVSLIIQPADSNSYGLRVENLVLEEYRED